MAVRLSFLSFAGKLATTMSLLLTFHRHYGEKTVVVSNFTGTLDILEALCKLEGLASVRLDGRHETSTSHLRL